MLTSKWYSALLDVDVDADLTEEVDLGGSYEFLTVLIPTLTEDSKIEAQIAMESGGTFFPVWRWKETTASDIVGQTSSITTTRAIVFRIGGAQFVKIGVEGTDMVVDQTFYLKGYNRN